MQRWGLGSWEDPAAQAAQGESMSAFLMNAGHDPFAAMPLTFIVENSSDPQCHGKTSRFFVDLANLMKSVFCAMMKWRNLGSYEPSGVKPKDPEGISKIILKRLTWFVE